MTEFTAGEVFAEIDPSDLDLSDNGARPNGRLGNKFAQFSRTKPEVGEPVESTSVTNVIGDSVQIPDRVSNRPTLIVFGSISCPVFRANPASAVATLQRERANDLTAYVVYICEAHPANDPSPYSGSATWLTQSNIENRILVRQPVEFARRVSLARATASTFSLDERLVLVDDMSNSVFQHYGSLPNSLYLFDRNGVVQFKEPWAFQSMVRDPAGGEREEWEVALEATLADR